MPPHLRARLSDYVDSGYDRGHLAPAADHRASEAALAATFRLSNVSPQVGSGFNRDYWARIERFVRGLTAASIAGNGGEVFVVTGPLFVPEWHGAARRDTAGSEASAAAHRPGTHQAEPSSTRKDSGRPVGTWRHRHVAIGQPLHWVDVPTHFFKAVVVRHSESFGSEPLLVAAFVVPNAPIAPSTPLADFVVPLPVVEAVAGLSLFRGLFNLADVAAAEDEYARSRTGGPPSVAVSRVSRVLMPQYPIGAAALVDGGAQPHGNEYLDRRDDADPLRGSGDAAEVTSGNKQSKGKRKHHGRPRPVRHLCSAVPCTLDAAAVS